MRKSTFRRRKTRSRWGGVQVTGTGLRLCLVSPRAPPGHRSHQRQLVVPPAANRVNATFGLIFCADWNFLSFRKTFLCAIFCKTCFVFFICSWIFFIFYFVRYLFLWTLPKLLFLAPYTQVGSTLPCYFFILVVKWWNIENCVGQLTIILA